jgi:DNA polymerase elongation subunit (family B)
MAAASAGGASKRPLDDEDDSEGARPKRGKVVTPFEEQMLEMVTRKPGRPPVSQEYIDRCRKEGFEFQLTSTRVDDSTGIITLFGITKERHSVAIDVTQYYYYAFIDLPPAWAEDPESVPQLRDLIQEMANTNIAAAEPPPAETPWKRVRKHTGRVIAVDFQRGKNMFGYDDNGDRFFARLTVNKRETLYQLQRVFECHPFTLAGQTWTPHLYESNIDKNTRFMADLNIVGLGLVRVKPSKDGTLLPGRDSVYTTQIYASYPAECVRGVDDFDDLWDIETLFFDCEMAGRKGIFCQPEVDPVIQIAAMSHIHREKDPYARYVFVLDGCEPIQGATVLSFKHEADLLNAFARHVLETDPDIISGYNINNFDLPYLIKRAEVIGAGEMAFLGRTAGIPCTIKVRRFESKAYGASETKDLQRCDGRIIMDCIEWVRRDYKFRFYNLNAVCYELLGGLTKEEVPPETITPLHKSGPAGRRRIAIYCLKDTWLPARITSGEQKIYNVAETARVCRVPPEYLFTRGQSVKVIAQMLHYTKRDGFFIPYMKSFGERGTNIDDEGICEEEVAEAKGLDIPLEDEGAEESDGAHAAILSVEELDEEREKEREEEEEKKKKRERPMGEALKWTDAALKRPTKRKAKAAVDEEPAAKKTKGYAGATVLEPIRGFHRKPVICNDFSSLYPSIMIAHNTCYTTLVRKDIPRPRSLQEGDTEMTPIKAEFVQSKVRKGLLPVILEDLLAARKRAKKDMENEETKNGKGTPLYNVYNNRQLALKVSANSVYGFTGATIGPLPCLEIGASVTAFGRDLIKFSKDFVEKNYTKDKGCAHDARVLYGDTVRLLWGRVTAWSGGPS